MRPSRPSWITFAFFAGAMRRRNTDVLLPGALLVVVVMLVATNAHANEPPTVRLSYRVGEGATDCPDELTLRNAVSARLGYDPFQTGAPNSISAEITRGVRGFRAVIELRSSRGEVTGSRLLNSTRNDCSELASAMVLSISIAIDPLVLSRRASPSPPLPLPEFPQQCPLCPEPPPCPLPPPPPSAPISFRASAGTLAALGSAPTLAFGATMQAGLRRRNASLALEGRIDIPASETISAREGVETTLLLASIVPCVHHHSWMGCALVSAGALRGVGKEVDVPRKETTAYVAMGARLGAEIPLTYVLALQIHLDVLAPLIRTTLRLNDADAWTTPPLSAALGAGVAATFP
jgi:hypothetical protein